MITVRYHIASLSAVILTLGIGIWIGLILNSASLEKNLIRSYRVKLAEVQQERQDDAAMLDQTRQALTALASHTSRSMLLGKRVAIIRTGDYNDAVQDATDALEQTGATIVSSTTISDQFDYVSDKLRASLLGPLASVPPWSASIGDNSSLYHTIVQALKTGTTKRQDVQDAIDRMSSAGLISYSGDFQQAVDLVIIVGGLTAQPTDVDVISAQTREKMVLDELTSSSGFAPVQIVGCEPSDVGTSSVPAYEQEGIASVDCIDEPIGALDVVFALRGEPAAYGVKSSAHQLVPSSLQISDGN